MSRVVLAIWVNDGRLLAEHGSSFAIHLNTLKLGISQWVSFFWMKKEGSGFWLSPAYWGEQ